MLLKGRLFTFTYGIKHLWKCRGIDVRGSILNEFFGSLENIRKVKEDCLEFLIISIRVSIRCFLGRTSNHIAKFPCNTIKLLIFLLMKSDC